VFQTGHDETVKSLVIVMDDQIEKEKVMSIAWNKDVDAALAEASSKKRPLLLDFNAAPM
jgi:hypothetical protein